MSARDDYPQARDVTLRKYDFAAYQVGKALDEIDRLRDDDLFDLVGTWYVRHADGTTEDIELTHGNLVENNVGTCGQFIIRRAAP